MSCPPDANTGFVTLVGPIQSTDLNAISVSKNPLTFSFGAKTTPPTLVNGNKIDEPSGNSITYLNKSYLLADIQICKVIHDTFRLPGQTQTPVAELILSFYASVAPPTYSLELSGIVLCVPIYNSGNPSHNEYLDQLVDPSSIACNYTNESGAEYEGDSYKSINDSSLIKCVKACCDDTNCLAYTFKSGICYLKNNIPPINKNRDSSIISGTINRNSPLKSQCESNRRSESGSSAIVPNLESIFYESSNDKSQTSFAYKSCFEVVTPNNQLQSKNLYIFIYPNGIHLTQQNFENLRLRINNTLKDYEIPPAIRGTEPTLYSYTMNNGNKIIKTSSTNGNLYKTSISTCTDQFKTRFEYFTLPPYIKSNKSNSLQFGNSPGLLRALDQCDYYKTTQYKCVPFDQLRDLSGEYVIPGNVTMDELMKKQNQTQQEQNKGILPSVGISTTMTTSEIETTISYVLAGSIAAIIIAFGASKFLKK